MRIGELIAHYISAVTEMVQEERWTLDLISSFKTGGEELNCLGEVSDKESASTGLDAQVLFARQQVGKMCVE